MKPPSPQPARPRPRPPSREDHRLFGTPPTGHRRHRAGAGGAGPIWPVAPAGQFSARHDLSDGQAQHLLERGDAGRNRAQPGRSDRAPDDDGGRAGLSRILLHRRHVQPDRQLRLRGEYRHRLSGCHRRAGAGGAQAAEGYRSAGDLQGRPVADPDPATDGTFRPLEPGATAHLDRRMAAGPDPFRAWRGGHRDRRRPGARDPRPPQTRRTGEIRAHHQRGLEEPARGECRAVRRPHDGRPAGDHRPHRGRIRFTGRYPQPGAAARWRGQGQRCATWPRWWIRTGRRASSPAWTGSRRSSSRCSSRRTPTPSK
ncbi:MAG: hypothetical protein MZW92_46875 [Comamonadaceae bacterium]|nr:hypothetical protein [Comamonadaceae bacterium]